MKLIYLGCSLSRQGGKAEHLARLLNLSLVNLAVSAGSNPLALRRFQEYSLHNDIHETDILVWQLTWCPGPYNRVKLDRLNEAQSLWNRAGQHYDISNSTNLFDKDARIDLLCNSPMQSEFESDIENQLEILLSWLRLLKKSHSKILIYPGASSIMDPKYKTIIFSELDSIKNRVISISVFINFQGACAGFDKLAIIIAASRSRSVLVSAASSSSLDFSWSASSSSHCGR
jgi:hypothetical protein